MLHERTAIAIGDAWRVVSQRLGRLDARLLVEHVACCTHADLLAAPERQLTPEQTARLNELVKRRADGQPIAYLLGRAGFYGRDFVVTPAVLVPRPETELLVELALATTKDLAAPRIVDLGTGCGAIAVTLVRQRPEATLTAVDRSAEALAVARINAERHRVILRLVAGDWYAPLAGERFDLIVSNPPYVAVDDPHLQGDGVRWEPRHALTDGVAGGDGLACIRAIVNGATKHLRSRGSVLIEHGYQQAAAVRDLLAAAGFSAVSSWRDLAGVERVSGGVYVDGGGRHPVHSQ